MTDIVEAKTTLDLSLSEAELEAVRDHLGTFIVDRMDAAGAEQAIIALSGGIDSTLTAHLLVDALAPDRVYGLVLPSEVNRPENMSDAERVAEDLAIEYDVAPVGPVTDAVRAVFPAGDPDRDPDGESARVSVGNLRARTRAVISYFAANRRQGLVVGTGNRSEAAVGYFTKYGDGAVDCHPIANLYKGQVRQLAAHLGVPEDLVEKPASAELWADQTDVGELGMGYPTLDSILALAVDGPLSTAATARQVGVDEAAVEHVRALHERSAHKRAAPPGPEPLY